MKTTGSDPENGFFKFHHVKFYNPTPRQIKCLAFNKETKRLAVSRDDASIEIWNMKSAVFMEKCILGLPSWSVEGLGWLGNRLFSTGLSGELIEWNLKELKPKTSVTITGNASLCMDIHNGSSCIAVGTQDGFVNTFWINGADINFSKLFDKQEGAIWCCRYNHTGEYIVTGSTDTIRIWDVATGHVKHRMATGRTEKNKETNVWSLVVLKDLTIIAGDSSGFITIWNGHNGTRIDSIGCLQADILSVAVNDTETFFCCSGVDPKIQIFVPLEKTSDKQRQWLRYLKRSDHNHDVKALTFYDENQIISGGADGYINVSCTTKNSKFKSSRYGPFLPQPCAVVAKPSRLLLLKHFDYVEVWRLGRPSDDVQSNDDSSANNRIYSMVENEEKIYEFHSKHDMPITCASISPDGRFLIHSTESVIRLFQLDIQTKQPSLTKVLVASDKFTPCAKVLFSSDSKSLYCVKNSGDIEIFALSYNDDVDIKETISTKGVVKDAITSVCLSECGKYLACAGSCGSVGVWKHAKGQWSSHLSVKSQPDQSVTALAMNSNACSIVIAYSDYKIHEYDLTSNKLISTTKSVEDGSTQRVFNKMDTAITNMLVDENNERFLLVHNDSALSVLEKSIEQSNNLSQSKTRRKKETNPSNAITCYSRNSHLPFRQHLIHLAWLSPDEIVAIIVDPEKLKEMLPPSMKRKEFRIA